MPRVSARIVENVDDPHADAVCRPPKNEPQIQSDLDRVKDEIVPHAQSLFEDYNSASNQKDVCDSACQKDGARYTPEDGKKALAALAGAKACDAVPSVDSVKAGGVTTPV